MIHIIFTLLLHVFASARPQNSQYGKLNWLENYNDETGNFRYAYQIDDTIFQDHKGELKLATDNTQVSVITGRYSISTPENIVQEVRYVADENGYKPQVTIVKQDQHTPSTINNIAPKLENAIINASSSVQPEVSTAPSAQEEKKEESKDENIHPQAVVHKPMQNSTTLHQMNHTAEEEFPDRIGTAVIITLAGPPG